MAREIPSNEAKTVTVKVPASNLFAFLEEVNKERNVIEVAYTDTGTSAGYEVTVTYAIMDLALKLASISTTVQNLAENASRGVPLRTPAAS